MASLTPPPSRQLIKIRYAPGVLLWLLATPGAFASTLGVFEYRFTVPPNISIEPNETQARDVIAKLQYAGADKEQLWQIARRLQAPAAASFLDDYQREYARRNEVLDSTWGRAVFCLGMLQVGSARDRLLKLWDGYDQLLAADKIKITTRDIDRGLRPLLVIGDALHFYLWDGVVRQWFEERIRELDTLSKAQTPNLAREARRIDREHLIVRLLTWDIVESIDEGPVIVPQRLTAFSPFTQTHVKNLERAADRAVSWAGHMQPLDPTISVEQWRQIRRSRWESSFDEVCGHLGKPLGMMIWRRSLAEPDQPVLNEDRVWYTALLTILYTVEDRAEQSWRPDDQENQMLKDAIVYATRLPEGHLQQLVVRCLFMMSAYAPDATDNVQVKHIREIASRLLDEYTRTSLLSNATMNRRMIDRRK